MPYVLAPRLFGFTETSDSSLVGPGTEYPFGYTTEELDILFYRIKTFRTTFDMHIETVIDGGAGTYNVVDLSYDEVSDLPYRYSTWTEANDEIWVQFSAIGHAYAAKSQSVDAYRSYVNGALDKVQDASAGYTGSASRQVLNIVRDGYSYDGLSYPRIRFSCDVWVLPKPSSGWSGGAFYQVSLSPGGGRSLNSDVIFYDPVNPSRSTDLYTFNYTPAALDASVCEFWVGAESYWPYDPGDTDPYPGKAGYGPVYDSVTGAQLRNPFNIVKRGDGTFYNPNYTP